MKKMSKVILKVILLCGIICILVCIYFLNCGFLTNKNIIIQEVYFQDSHLIVKGDFNEGFFEFARYNYRIENNVLYLKIHKTLPSFFHRYSNFMISIPYNTQIDCIYLSSKEEQKLVWKKE